MKRHLDAGQKGPVWGPRGGCEWYCRTRIHGSPPGFDSAFVNQMY